MFDPGVVRKDFPILERRVKGNKLVYLDSAATSQKPLAVIEAMVEYYKRHNSNVHRGAHTLGDESTGMYGAARERVAKFIGASRSEEVVFVRNSTEAMNLVAYAWGLNNLGKGDVVLTTRMEHHSNIVPWQLIGKYTGCRVKYAEIDDQGYLDMGDLKGKLSDEVKLVTLVHVSNALGTINPIKEIARLVKRNGSLLMVDGSQAVAHMKVDVKSLGVDFYGITAHKMLGPMGIGALWGRRELLEKMDPFMGGGGMVNEVGLEESSFARLPDKFEAGTPNVAGAVGWARACEYLDNLGMERVREHDKWILEYALERLGELKEVRLLGPMDAGKRSGSVSFVYERVHGHDVATVLDSQGVAVRAGHHCTMPLHKYLGIPASVRASFNVYTTKDDIDKLISALGKVKEVFGE